MRCDAADVKNRINEAANSMGALKHRWNAKEMPISMKIKLHQVITMNLTL